MPSKKRHGFLISLVVIGLVVVSFNASYGQTINYIYDDLNRLKEVAYDNGIVIHYTYDEVGNRLEEKIELDTTPPTGSIIINSGVAFTTSTTVTLTLSCNDSSDCSQMQFSNNNVTYSTPETYATTKAWVLTTGDGTKTAYVKFKDMVGNWSTPYSDTILLDTTLPTGTITINSGAALTNSAGVTLTLSCNDAYGCSQMQFSNDNITFSTPEAYGTTKAWTLISGDATKTVYAKFKDTAGNWSIAYSDTILLDTTAPISTASPGGGFYSTAQSVTLTCGDGAGSGCDKIYYTTDGSTPTTSSPAYSAPINILFPMTLKFFARDLVGNSEAVKTETYVIDSAVCPNPPVKIGGTPYSSLQAAYNAAVNGDIIKCRDLKFIENLTINRNIAVTLEGGYNCGFTTNLGGRTIIKGMITTTAGGGTITIGNFVLGDTTLPDTTAPISTASPRGGFYYEAQSVTLTCSDGPGSGCDKIYYTTDGTTPTTSSPVYSSPINILINTTLKFFAKDLAGNSEAAKTETYVIDPSLCPNPPVRIGGTSYTTLQAAYNAAVNGDVIKCRNVTFIENLTVNRNIAVTLEGGYNCEFTTNVGGKTTIKGMLTTTAGGGTITIKNFFLQN